jgi:homopolymeric O-antigen transport system ATP-binding protein
MSSAPVISVRGLGKRYRIWTHAQPKSLSDRVEIIAASLRHRARRETHSLREEIWALRNVSFDVRPGEVLGVIGPNGAGKSTLLAILARITEPTEGVAEIEGHVASLLEVGTGFHPELSGRDNVFLNGAILGMSRRETAEKFEQIVEFAGVGDFIDMAVKRYSSGMYVRLAFAVAAHLDPEVLLLDEVLAVGDSAFQQKCLRRIDELTHSGRTVLFVSHQPAAVAQLCHRAIVINGGSVVFEGKVEQALEHYLGSPQLDGGPSAREQQRLARGGTGEVRVAEARVFGPDGEAPMPGAPVTIELDLVPAHRLVPEDISLRIGIWSDSCGEPVTLTWTPESGRLLAPLQRGKPTTVACELDELPLRSGTYLLAVAVERGAETLDASRYQLEFVLDPLGVAGAESAGSGSHQSLVLVRHRWASRSEPANAPAVRAVP